MSYSIKTETYPQAGDQKVTTLSSINPNDATAICGQEPREQKLVTLSGWGDVCVRWSSCLWKRVYNTFLRARYAALCHCMSNSSVSCRRLVFTFLYLPICSDTGALACGRELAGNQIGENMGENPLHKCGILRIGFYNT